MIFLVRSWQSSKLSTGRTDRGVDYRFYNCFPASFINAEEALVVLRGMDRRLPSGNPTGWDFSEVPNDLVGSNSDFVQLRTNLSGWVDTEEELANDEELVEVADPSSSPNINSTGPVSSNTTSGGELLEVVRRYLREIAGVPETVISSSYEALFTYMKGPMH